MQILVGLLYYLICQAKFPTIYTVTLFMLTFSTSKTS